MTSEPDVAREDDQNPRADQAMVAETVMQADYTIALIGAGVAMFRVRSPPGAGPGPAFQDVYISPRGLNT
jgi:hypothetical protein